MRNTIFLLLVFIATTCWSQSRPYCLPAQYNKKYGVKDSTGRWLVPPVYDRMDFSYDNKPGLHPHMRYVVYPRKGRFHGIIWPLMPELQVPLGFRFMQELNGFFTIDSNQYYIDSSTTPFVIRSADSLRIHSGYTALKCKPRGFVLANERFVSLRMDTFVACFVVNKNEILLSKDNLFFARFSGVGEQLSDYHLKLNDKGCQCYEQLYRYYPWRIDTCERIDWIVLYDEQKRQYEFHDQLTARTIYYPCDGNNLKYPLQLCYLNYKSKLADNPYEVNIQKDNLTKYDSATSYPTISYNGTFIHPQVDPVMPGIAVYTNEYGQPVTVLHTSWWRYAIADRRGNYLSPFIFNSLPRFGTIPKRASWENCKAAFCEDNESFLLFYNGEEKRLLPPILLDSITGVAGSVHSSLSYGKKISARVSYFTLPDKPYLYVLWQHFEDSLQRYYIKIYNQRFECLSSVFVDSLPESVEDYYIREWGAALQLFPQMLCDTVMFHRGVFINLKTGERHPTGFKTVWLNQFDTIGRYVSARITDNEEEYPAPYYLVNLSGKLVFPGTLYNHHSLSARYLALMYSRATKFELWTVFDMQTKEVIKLPYKDIDGVSYLAEWDMFIVNLIGGDDIHVLKKDAKGRWRRFSY